MNQLAIYGLLTGANQCSQTFGIEKSTVMAWIGQLDFENHQFFLKMRMYVVVMIGKFGLENTAEILELPRNLLQMLRKKYFKVPREAKKEIIKMHRAGVGIEEISNVLASSSEIVQFVIGVYHEGIRRRNCEVHEVIDLEVKQESIIL